MLKRLLLENFALTNKLEIEFESGLSVLTGETGAGKSIIVGAIARLLGEKVDRDDIRSGCSQAVIECDFNISKNSTSNFRDITNELKDLDIEIESDLLNIRREIFDKRSSKSFINNQLVTLGQLRQISKYLAELYGQHSHQLLLDEKNHLNFLDSFAGLTEKVERLRLLFGDWDSTKREVAKLISNREQRKKELELLKFQKDEIEKANIRIGEEEELQNEKRLLDSSQKLADKSTNILNLIERQEPSAFEILETCRNELSKMCEIDKSLENANELLNQAIINISELRTEIEAYQSSIPDNPNRQEQINIRLDELFKLKNKYGRSEEAIIETLNSIDKKIGADLNIDDKIRELQKSVNKHFDKYYRSASDISSKRQKSSKNLSKKVESELAQLSMDKSKFIFEFLYESDSKGIAYNGQKIKPTPNGFESGRFLISTNPGEPLKPLARIASGGEVSRIMLALKAAEKQNLKGKNIQRNLLVFDEIDVGIGGITANAVAEKLELLSQKYQLLVVTHLHQIAAKSDFHYAVKKSVQKSSKRNIISVKKLNKSERSGEITRMLAIPEKIKS
ncbi:MAG: DNA repair protein RecN [candidate division Zixibacteria bacterium]|nr:DNA repair protein RecN [candidate division Zixibacteria bacterium]